MSAAEGVDAILARHGVKDPIDMAVVLGAGLAAVTDNLEGAVSIPYAELPGFPSAAGQAGALCFVKHDNVHVAYMRGRAHVYEQGDPAAMAAPLETLALIGARQFVLTSTVGSVRADLSPGHLVLVNDHINFGGMNPLIGLAADGGFVNMTNAYDPKLSWRLKRAAALSGVPLHEGVLMWFSGPSYETPAEIRMARTLGADIVGMAIAPEVVLCRRLGAHVAAVTLVANFGAGFSGGNPSHSETIAHAQAGALSLRRLLRAFFKTREKTA